MRAVLVMLLLVTPAIAHADDDLLDDPVEEDDPDAMVAHLACVPDKDKNVACTVVVDDKPAGEKARATAWITQGGTESRMLEGVQTKAKAPSYAVEGVFARGTDFAPCTPYVVHAQIVVGDEALWDGELAVAATCKKPKKVKATLSCTYHDDRGVGTTFPLKQSKKKSPKQPAITGPVSCEVRATKLKKPGNLSVRMSAGGEVHQEALYKDDCKAIVSWQVLLPDVDFTPCAPFTVVAAIVDPDGQAAWSGKLTMGKTCAP